jgi:hypothetical protein
MNGPNLMASSQATREKGQPMKVFAISLSAAVLIGLSFSVSMAQTPEPTYKADPDTYKIILEDSNYRVIEANHRKGVHDKEHSHPVPFVVINLTDCKTRLYGADGTTRDNVGKAGAVQINPAIPSHSAQEMGDADCKQIFVEKK